MARAPVTTAEAAADAMSDLAFIQVQEALQFPEAFAAPETDHDRAVWSLIANFWADQGDQGAVRDTTPPARNVPVTDTIAYGEMTAKE